jgi:Leucine-rich repeat (LRR) protein
LYDSQLARADSIYNVPDTEITALQDLYDATNGDSWNWIGTGNQWNFTDPNPCVDAWQGVTCSQVPIDGYLHVVEVELSGYGLVGYIPMSIAQLTQLGTFRLSYNELTGTVPESISQLTVLAVLFMNSNLLTGTIPDSIDQLSQLSVLDLDSNLLSGTLSDSLLGLTQLTGLYLDYNSLTGTVPASVAQLTQLTLLALDDNLLSGPIPETFQQLAQLSQLYLYDNQLTGTIPASIGQLPRLTILDVDTNQLSGTIPESLQQLTQLTQLYLYDNLLTGTMPAAIGELTKLSLLVLNGNLLSGTIPGAWQTLTQLTGLYLDYNQLTGTIPVLLGQLTQLELLIADGNLLSGTIPGELQQLTQLTGLYMDLNRLSGTIPAALGQLTQLTILDLGVNLLTGTIPDALQQLTQLTLLYVEINQLSGTIPDSLTTLVQLRAFQLGTNQLTGTIPNSLSQLTALELLEMQANSFTGTVPITLGQLPRLRAVAFNSNQLQGAIPQNWTAAGAVQVLHLQQNLLSGPIPESLGYMPKLLSLNLSSNHLTGTLPASFRNLTSLQVMMLHNNQLRGNVAELFSPTQQRNLSTVQLSGNQLTGTLPAAAFLLPSLSSFVGVDNCFEGPLPEEAICSSSSLSVLVLDGLHSASSCKYSLTRFKLGPLPPCLLSMPALVTLHLSGSGLTGSFATETNISALLTDLSLSHNLLTGKIPASILKRDWDKLDLSYNRLTGTLHSARAAPYSNASRLYLQHNRLSGVIPGSMQRVDSLTLLENNMFSCRVDRSDVPQQDTDSDRYSCGSDAVNSSLYAWLGVALAVVAAAVYGRNRGIEHLSSWADAVRDGSLAKLQDLIAAANTLRVLGTGGAAYCILVLLPVYAAVNAYHPSFTYKYAWTVSGVYLTGTAAFALEVVFLLLLLPICLYVAEWLLSHTTTPPPRQNAADEASGRSSATDTQHIGFKAVALLLISLAVVTSINAAFVIATLSLSGKELTVIQILLAVFKLGFNNIVVPALHHRTTAPGKRNGVSASQLLLVLLNVIVIPCLVVMVISPACFYDAITGSDRVTSSYQYGESCQTFFVYVDEGTATCANVQTEVGTTTYTPAFAYSYQCSSSFVTSYAPTYVIMCIISGFLLPAQRLPLLWLRGNLSPTSRLYSIVAAATPRILRELPSPQDLAQARSDPLYRPVFHVNKLVISLLTYLALLLTFGALFPPLAVCCAVAMASLALTARLLVGRYVNVAVAADRQDCLDEVESACAGVATPQQLRMALYLVQAVSCLFYTLFLFDTLGYEVGFTGAFWVLIVVPLLPVVAWATYAALRGRSPTTEATKTAPTTVDPEADVELADRQTASSAVSEVREGIDSGARDTRGRTDTASANPMHIP